MRVRVLFFGLLKDLVGKSSDSVQLPENASVRDVLALYESQNPRLKASLPSLAIAVNQKYAALETKLNPDDEVALLPPVSGGLAEVADNKSTAQPVRHCRIQRDAIDAESALAKIKRGDDGSAVTFEGVVRNQTRGRKTLYLEYEAYEEMALQQMEALAEQALRQFAIRDVALIHRLGRLEISETSVLIIVASPHRAAAFEACRWLIDTLKRTVPIWKKEFFEDGAVWADGEPFPPEVARANRLPQGSPDVSDASK